MSEGGGSKSSNKQSQKTTVPDFLKPFVDQIVGTSSGALGNLQNAAGGDTVADLNPDQLAALDLARGVAGGAGGFIPTAQQTFLDAAQGGGLENVLPPELLASISNPGSIDVGNGVSDVARGALESTARGDFLFGGEGFDEAVNAAVRSARPQILSTFGRAGAGGSTSGLAQSAVGQSAIDAFASQFANERRNQLGAAGQLGGFDLTERGQEIGAQESDLNRGATLDGLLANLSNSERGRQLSAAEALPGLGLLDSQILSDVGGVLQNQEQNELTGDSQSQLQLLQAALAGIPQLAALFGRKGKSKSSGLSLGFGG